MHEQSGKQRKTPKKKKYQTGNSRREKIRDVEREKKEWKKGIREPNKGSKSILTDKKATTTDAQQNGRKRRKKNHITWYFSMVFILRRNFQLTFFIHSNFFRGVWLVSNIIYKSVLHLRPHSKAIIQWCCTYSHPLFTLTIRWGAKKKDLNNKKKNTFHQLFIFF